MKPVLLYDEGSMLCRARVAQWQYRTGTDVQFIPYDDAWGIFPQEYGPIPSYQPGISFHLVDSDGEVYANAEAVCRMLTYAHHGSWRYALYKRNALFARVSDKWYSRTATNRLLCDKIHYYASGRDDTAATYYMTRWAFLRVIGLVYFIAFGSLWLQLGGLTGSEGIMPMADHMTEVQAALDDQGAPKGWQRLLLYPTVGLVNTTDLALNALCCLGMVAGLMLLVGLVPPLAALAAWLAYLSLVNGVPVFMAQPWDRLLVEVGFLTIFLTPIQIFPDPHTRSEPSAGVVFLLRWLLFRIVFVSGLMKLGDGTWTSLSALNHYFEVQPLPTVVGWYLELIVPFFIFAPRRLRNWAGSILIAYLGIILFTSNYGYFTFIALGLCLMLFDDAQAKRLFASATVSQIGAVPVRPTPWLLRKALVLAMAMFLVVSSLGTTARLLRPPTVEKEEAMAFGTDAFHLTSAYTVSFGLTDTRLDLIVEGSNDGVNWTPYAFRWLPGDVKQRPRWMQPHVPRIDWQMLAEARNAQRGESPNQWLTQFLDKLQAGSKDVVALVMKAPFGDTAPRYLRVRRYEYTFTSLETRREDGAWWERTDQGSYVGPTTYNNAAPPEQRRGIMEIR
jgi:predicted DCC family thiol-disulfide oxidoreductase YuxK